MFSAISDYNCIKIAADKADDYMCILQIRVACYRRSDPNTKVYGFVNVNVIRNPTAPAFIGSFIFNITETQMLGEVFGTASATDPDPVSVFSFLSVSFHHKYSSPDQHHNCLTPKPQPPQTNTTKTDA